MRNDSDDLEEREERRAAEEKLIAERNAAHREQAAGRHGEQPLLLTGVVIPPAPHDRPVDETPIASRRTKSMPLNIKDLAITCGAFGADEAIPTEHAREGADETPMLSISGVPEGTRELAIICHDPDAPLPNGFTHWVVYGIPADVTEIRDDGAFTQGVNDYGNPGYNGPNPPEGHGPHRYYFWVYALDAPLDAPPGLSRAELVERMADHIIEQARIVGTYER